MYTYGQVEAALAKVHKIPPERFGAFRGRIKHFQRIGLVPSSPGRGKRISYEDNDIYLWAFALQLSEFGIDPIIIKRVVDDMQFHALRAFLETTGDDWTFIMYPNFMSGMSTDFDKRTTQNAIPSYEFVQLGKIELSEMLSLSPRVAMVNTGAVSRTLKEALGTI